MHQLTLQTPIPSVSEVQGILTSHTNRLGIPMDYDRILEYYGYYKIHGYGIRGQLCKYIGANTSALNYDNETFKTFLQKAGVNTGFLLTKGGQISMSRESLESVIATGLYSKEIETLISMHIEADADFKKVSMFTKLIDDYTPVPYETWDNHRMIIVKPLWVPQNTGRLGAQNPAVMNFSREVGDIFTVPKGWIYLANDSGQIEPRISQSTIIKDEVLKRCTMAYNDAYYGYIHYCNYLTDAQRFDQNTMIQAMQLTEELKAKRQKFKTFGNATLYGSTENRLNDPDKARFIKYIGGHPNRVKLQSQLEDRIERGQRVFHSAFGTPIDITKGPSDANYEDKTSSAYFSHLVKCAINNPMQATAADLMRYSVAKANNLLNRKAPNSVILQYVHDAGKFAIHENDYDAVIDELREITSYQVEDWVPIYCDPEEGVHAGKLPRFIA